MSSVSTRCTTEAAVLPGAKDVMPRMMTRPDDLRYCTEYPRPVRHAASAR